MSSNNGSSHRGNNSNKMLIDATHPEETRVVVLRSGRVEEFDYESAARKLLRGNIYLAKVTRVEPSLQAAFVDYGGNRHGFLAFNEIHPDYYQIPVADRRALIEAEAQAEAEEEEAADRAAEAAAARRERRQSRHQERRPRDAEDSAVDVAELLPPEQIEPTYDRPEEIIPHDDTPRSLAERVADDFVVSEPAPSTPGRDDDAALSARSGDHPATGSEGSYAADESAAPRRDIDGPVEHETRNGDLETAETDSGQLEQVEPQSAPEAEQVETVAAAEDVLEEVPVRPRRRLRSYKIQEVIKRRQVMLIQVVKEERGTKGAALTTYLSLAGRYTVLMPNTARGGGISRKITNPQDRKRLKAIAAELDVPEGMGLIIRTAGAARTKQEIKRDYEYLLRLWESVRELALGSNAPQLVYEEGNLIKRSIRDLYGKEVDEIVVAGEAAYREAHEFMGMLMPGHARNVIRYEGSEPLFARYNLERQLNAMFSPYVHLRSGGYLVINQTEALVAIDINSGKSTREFSIEETALSTNMEAAEEIARQVKLRDLAGLIVIDFIDMEEKRNNRAVERRLKDSLRHDRARIQLGRISHFGLLEMSRQRMRTGVVEGSTTQCPHCQGSGTIRSTESIALAVLRGIEDALNAGQPANLVITTTATVALYILNNKRSFIVEMEDRHGVTIQVQASDKVQGANFNIERSARREEPQRRPERAVVNMDWGFDESEPDAAADDLEAADEGSEPEERYARGGERGSERGADEDGESRDGGRRRRRRRRRGRRGDQPDQGSRMGTGRQDDDQARAPHAEDDRDDRDSDVPDQEPARFVDDEMEATGQGSDDGDEREPRAEGEGQGERGRRRRRRGRRGGRRGTERPHGEGEGDDARSASNGAETVEITGHSHDTDYHADDRPPVIPEDMPGSEPRRIEVRVHDEPMIPAAHELPRVPEPVEAPVAQAAPSTPAQPEPEAPAPAPAPVAEEPAPPRRGPPVSSEPVLERVVIGSSQTVETVETSEQPKPARRGWWQRR